MAVQISRGCHPELTREAPWGHCEKPLGEVFRKLGEQKESRIDEGYLLPDQVRIIISIPPKYTASRVVGFIMGKRAIHLARVYGKRKENVFLCTSLDPRKRRCSLCFACVIFEVCKRIWRHQVFRKNWLHPALTRGSRPLGKRSLRPGRPGGHRARQPSGWFWMR